MELNEILGESPKEYFGSEVMRSREGGAKVTGRACLNAISLKIEKTPKGRVLERSSK